MKDLKAFLLVCSSVILVIIALLLANKVTGKAVERDNKREITMTDTQDQIDFLFDFLNTAQDVLDNGSKESEAMAKAAIHVMYNYVTLNLPERAIDVFYTDRIIQREEQNEKRDA